MNTTRESIKRCPYREELRAMILINLIQGSGMFGMLDILGPCYSLVCQEILHRELCEQVCLLLPLHLAHRSSHSGSGRQNIYQVHKLKIFIINT